MGDALHDIVLPESVSWMPQTIGWWILLAVALVIGLRAAFVARRRYRANRYRRLALAELEGVGAALESGMAPVDIVAAIPTLVKKTALAAWPRETVASLNGEPWLRFLDESYGGSGFTKGPGRLLSTLAYEPDGNPASEDIHRLTSLVRDWIRGHRVRV